MIVHRIATEKYVEDLSGTGAKLYGGRWNEPGFPAIYTTENLALAVLEILVRTGIDLIPPDYFQLQLQVPEKLALQKILVPKLKKNWKEDYSYTQWMGTEFLKNKKFAVLQVPSAIIESSYNYILNPLHTDFKKIAVISSSKFEFDKRLFLRNE